MNETEQTYHVPVLLQESICGLNLQDGGIYVDVTFGGGGHSREILRRMGKESRLFSFDQDEDAERNIVDDSRFTFVRSNFRYLRNFLRYYGVEEVDGILADLGVSFHHFDDSNRGFSFRFPEGKLDMRMNRDDDTDACKVVNTYDAESLTRIFKLYGDLKNARNIAGRIVKSRVSREIVTSGDLLEVVSPLVNPRQEKKELAQIFQALRMEVNHEVDALSEFLEQTAQILRPGGRLAVITYHSVEDRMVKNFMRSGNMDGKVETDFFGHSQSPWKIVNNKVIIPSDDEVERNPRSRSAKLRIAEKL